MVAGCIETSDDAQMSAFVGDVSGCDSQSATAAGNPVFIIGVFRSGTSLLCSLLNQNPDIALMYECDVWNFPNRLLKSRFDQNWAARLEFYNQALSRHRMVDTRGFDGLANIRTPLHLYRAFGRQKGALVSGEKSPFYCDRLVQLHERYPQAAFILVWRNPVEIYRSVLKAGQTSRFFGKPGMLSRLIYLQEQAVQQSAQIEKLGARIYRLDYASLVDQTEKICRETCDFLGVPFDPCMLELNTADLSAIYNAPHHAFLRRGVIERQKYTGDLMAPGIKQKLERYRRRWEQMQAGWLKPANNPDAPLPGTLEILYHRRVGRTLTIYDSLVRTGFEFLPLSWLRVYRMFKSWVFNPRSGAIDEKTSLREDFQEHRFTILLAAAAVALISYIHYQSNPHLHFGLFYAMPCALLALVVNVRWASLFVLACSSIAPIIQYAGDSDYRPTGVFIWNFLTRLVLLQLLVLFIGRIKLDFAEDGYKAT